MNILIDDGSEHADAARGALTQAGRTARAEVLVLPVLDAWHPEEDQAGGKAGEARRRLCIDVDQRRPPLLDAPLGDRRESRA